MPIIALRPTQETVNIVAALGGTWHGYFAMCICPAHADRTPSLSIRQGRQNILVHCFAGCRNEDVLREIGRTRPCSSTPMPAFRPNRFHESALRIWGEGREVRDTLGETYLRYRHLPIDLTDVRFHPRCPLGKKPNTRFLPALLVASREGMKIKAVQRIILRTDGRGHEGKFTLGHPGASAWCPRIKGSTLALAESMEDAAAYTRMHGINCWSSFGNERLSLLRLPPDLNHLIIAEDNNRAGRLGAINAVKAYKRPGLTIRRHPPPAPFEDWAEANAKLMGSEA